MSSVLLRLLRLFQRVMPFLVLAWLGFLEFAYCYVFCHTKVHTVGVSIALTVLFNVFLALVLSAWLLIFVNGPGVSTVTVPPYDLDRYYKGGQEFVKTGQIPAYQETEKPPAPGMIAPPDFFPCDEAGLPEWCAVCGSLKVLRAHHSSHNGRCVLEMDHFCSFIGSIIGKANYGNFLVFIVSLDCLMVLCIVSIFSYMGRMRHSIHAAVILAVVTCVVFCLPLSNLVSGCVGMVSVNDTTIERLSRSRLRKALRRQKKDPQNAPEPQRKYMNVRHPRIAGLRVVVPLRFMDFPYHQGSFLANLRERLRQKEFACTTAQQIMEYENNLIRPTFRDRIYKRIEAEDSQVTVFGSKDVQLA